MVIDEFTLANPGNQERLARVLLRRARPDDATRRGYLDKAYVLGRQF